MIFIEEVIGENNNNKSTQVIKLEFFRTIRVAKGERNLIKFKLEFCIGLFRLNNKYTKSVTERNKLEIFTIGKGSNSAGKEIKTLPLT